MRTMHRWGAALVAMVGCASPVPRNRPVDAADAAANDGAEEDRDAVVSDARDAAGDEATGTVDGAADAEASVDAAVDVEVGPPTMRMTFVGGALRGAASDGGISMRAVVTWHGAIRGQSSDGRIQFRGWFR